MPGRFQLNSFATEEDVARAFQKLRQTKERRGYWLIGQGRGRPTSLLPDAEQAIKRMRDEEHRPVSKMASLHDLLKTAR